MVTGDNALTALAVARSCGDGIFVHPGLPAYILDAHDGVVKVTSVESGKEIPLSMITSENWKSSTLVVTGAAFSILPSEVEATVHHAEDEEEGSALGITKEEVLQHVRIYARFNPREKQSVVRGLQQLGWSVAMAGDGANDSFALKQADAGISICSHIEVITDKSDKSTRAEIESAGEAEAAVPSIAAHFSTPVEDITAVRKLLSEGRGALATSMVVVRYMLAYGATQFASVAMVSIRNLDMTDAMYMWGDLFNVLPLSLLLTLTKASEILSPGIPETDLMNIRGFLGGNIIAALLMVMTQIFLYLLIRTQSFYSSGDESKAEYDRTIMFYTSSTQFVIIALALSHTYGGFRKPAYTNPPLVIAVAVLLVTNLVVILVDVPWIDSHFGLVNLPEYFCWIMVVTLLVLTLVYVLIEQVGFRHVKPFPKALQADLKVD